MITFEKYATTVQSLASAEYVKAKKGGSEFFQLPNKSLGLIALQLNQDNPALVYFKALAETNGEGSVSYDFEIEDAQWKLKTQIGNGTFDKVAIPKQFIEWNKPLSFSQAMSISDINSGVPNVLAQRVGTATKRLLQEWNKKLFQKLLDRATEDVSITKAKKLDLNDETKLKKFHKQLLQTVEKFIKDNDLNESDVIITLQSEIAALLAANNIIGNFANEAFIAGFRSVSTLGGYTVQKGGKYLPKTIKVGTTTKTDKEVYAIIGTSTAGVARVRMNALNYERVLPTNDVSSYAEVQTLGDTIKYNEHQNIKKVHAIIEE